MNVEEKETNRLINNLKEIKMAVNQLSNGSISKSILNEINKDLIDIEMAILEKVYIKKEA